MIPSILGLELHFLTFHLGLQRGCGIARLSRGGSGRHPSISDME